MQYRIYKESPLCLVFILTEKEAKEFCSLKSGLCTLIDKIAFQVKHYNHSGYLRFRGVEYDRLPVVLRQGIDVIPTDSVIYTAESACKAMEYGWYANTQKMILLMYDAAKISRTFIECPNNTPADELKELMQIYPTKVELSDTETVWLSRLKKEDKRLATPYEADYAGWISRNPFEALVGIIAIGVFTENELEELYEMIDFKLGYTQITKV